MQYKQKSVRLPRSAEQKQKWKRIIVILQHCPLQSIQTDKGFELLSQRHRNYHARHKSDPAEWRPDVVHQCLLHLQDCALNRAGMLQVFLRTKKGVCLSIDPRLRVPRHIRLFEKMMVSALFKMKVRASNGYLSLIKVIRNPITDHIPANTTFYRVERDGEMIDHFVFAKTCGYNSNSNINHISVNNNNNNNAINTTNTTTTTTTTNTTTNNSSSTNNTRDDADSAANSNANTKTTLISLQQQLKAKQNLQFCPFAFVIGGMSKGDVNVDYALPQTVKSIRIADRGMSAAAVISQLTHAFEECWLDEDNHTMQAAL